MTGSNRQQLVPIRRLDTASRIVGTAAQLALTLAEGLVLAVGAVLLWLVAMAVLPAEWQALVTLVFLAAVVAGLLGLVDMLCKND